MINYAEATKPSEHKSLFEVAQTNTNTKLSLTDVELKDLKGNVQKEVMEKVEHKYLGKYRDADAKQAIQRQVLRAVEKNKPGLDITYKQDIVEKFTNEISGYGILEQFLDDKDITEILIEKFDKITIEREGKLEETNVKFDTEDDLRLVIDRILMPLGRRLDWSSPTVNARLSDGSRICVLIPPIAPSGTQASIRKFKPGISLDKLIEFGAINEKIKEILTACVQGRLSIIVSGGTGSGKSTFLNALSEYIDHNLSIITIENPIELQFKHPHVRRWEARDPNIEGKGEITQLHLVLTALRSRPDIIIVGESRGIEAFALMQALNTGHLGSMTTIHANTPHQGMKRLVSMVASAKEIPSELVPEYISESLDIVVQLNRMADGTRKLTEIAEVIGQKDGVILTQPLIQYKVERYDGEKVYGEWISTGKKFIREEILKDRGVVFPRWESAL